MALISKSGIDAASRRNLIQVGGKPLDPEKIEQELRRQYYDRVHKDAKAAENDFHKEYVWRDDESLEAFAARVKLGKGKGKGKGKGRKGKKGKGVCWNCGESGHFFFNCPNKNKDANTANCQETGASSSAPAASGSQEPEQRTRDANTETRGRFSDYMWDLM